MTKQELMETYTAEQLADKVIELEEIIDDKLGGWSKHGISYNDFFSMQDENAKLKYKAEKYRKAFEDAKKERDFQIAQYQKKIEELTAENDRLKGDVDGVNYQEKQDKTNNFYGIYAHYAKDLTKDDLLIFLGVLAKELIANGIDFRYEMGNEPKVWDIKIKSDKSISDFLPAEPIKVVDMLINAQTEYENNSIFATQKEYTANTFSVSELRQIAEHLLVYCNHNGEAEE